MARENTPSRNTLCEIEAARALYDRGMPNDDENRKAILARRARYIALALAGVSTATTACAAACLRVAPPTDAGLDSGQGESADANEQDAR